MGLYSQINDDYMIAYKGGETDKVSVLRLLKSQLKNLEIEKKAELTDEDAIRVLKREVKQREESIIEYTKGNRPELAEAENKEITILKTYLPEQLSDEEIEKIVLEKKNELGLTDPSQKGRLIGAVMQAVKGNADGNRVSVIVNRSLS